MSPTHSSRFRDHPTSFVMPPQPLQQHDVFGSWLGSMEGVPLIFEGPSCSSHLWF